jgi:hypothetical protein
LQLVIDALCGWGLQCRDQGIDLCRAHRLAEHKSLPRIAIKLRQRLEIRLRRNADRDRAATEIVRHLNDGLANPGIAFVGGAALDQRAVNFDFAERD